MIAYWIMKIVRFVFLVGYCYVCVLLIEYFLAESGPVAKINATLALTALFLLYRRFIKWAYLETWYAQRGMTS